MTRTGTSEPSILEPKEEHSILSASDYMVERQVRLSSTVYDWQEMRSLTALVVGVGAVGGEVLKHLAHLGVGRVLVIDCGVVTRSNFSRSVLFSSVGPTAEGAKKALMAHSVMKLWNPAAEVVPIIERIEDTGLGPFLEADLVFSCLDTEAGRIHVAIQAMQAGVPLVEGGMTLHDIESLEVVATDPVSGPCGMLCRWASMKKMAREGILPAAFYAHVGCTSVDQSSLQEQSTQGARSLSMTASVVASELVTLGLHLVRLRAQQQLQPYGTVINMFLRASGDQGFRQQQLHRCNDSDPETSCPLSHIRQPAQIALDARLCPVVALVGTVDTVTLDDVLRRGAAALAVAMSEAVVYVDEEFSVKYECKNCKIQSERPALIYHILRTHKCDIPDLVFMDAGRCSYDGSEGWIVSSIRGTSIKDMGFRAHPGWIVEGRECGGAVRVVLETPERGL